MLYPMNTTIFITFLKHHCHYMTKTKRWTGGVTGIAVQTKVTSSQVQSHQLNQISKHDAQNLDQLAFPGQAVAKGLCLLLWLRSNQQIIILIMSLLKLSPRFSDLNPLDFYIWSIVDWEIKQQPYNSKDLLKTFINYMVANINENHLIWVCNHF